MTAADLRIAVLVPCYNEEAAVATVVADFRKALPQAAIYVYDNNSKDRTVAVAREAGAEVRSEMHQGTLFQQPAHVWIVLTAMLTKQAFASLGCLERGAMVAALSVDAGR